MIINWVHNVMEKVDLRKIDSTSADGYYNKFFILLGMGRFDEAKIYARKAVELALQHFL